MWGWLKFHRKQRETETISQEVAAGTAAAPSPAETPRRDGTLKVLVRPEGVFLRVFPATGGGNPVSLEEACKALDAKGIVGVDMQAVREAINLGGEVKVAERRPELDRDGRAEVEVPPDEMAAYVRLFPPQGGKPLTFADLEAALAEAGVVYGIKREELQAACEQKRFGETILAAEGTPAENGQDAKIVYHFRTERRGRPVELFDGRVDFHNLDLLENVQEGTLLASKEPPTPGKPGMTVRGHEIPAKDGKDIVLQPGKNVVLSEDGRELRAAIAGQVVFNGKISVSQVYEVKGDVDFSTGNINFVGSVVVRGNVLEGFQIQASGNIDIFGGIEGAILEAEGDIILRSGIRGQDKAQIRAEGNVRAKFIENATVTAGESVMVNEAILHSRVDAGKSIEVQGGRGTIVGGYLRAGEEIRARVLGSKAGTRTELEVGVSPQVRDEQKKLTRELALQQNNLNKTLQAMRMAERLTGQGGDDQKQVELLEKLRETEEHIQVKIKELQERLRSLTLMLEQTQRGVVRASERIFPGVRVTIGNMSYVVQEEISHVSLRVEDGEIRVNPY